MDKQTCCVNDSIHDLFKTWYKKKYPHVPTIILELQKEGTYRGHIQTLFDGFSAGIMVERGLE